VIEINNVNFVNRLLAASQGLDASRAVCVCVCVCVQQRTVASLSDVVEYFVCKAGPSARPLHVDVAALLHPDASAISHTVESPPSPPAAAAAGGRGAVSSGPPSSRLHTGAATIGRTPYIGGHGHAAAAAAGGGGGGGGGSSAAFSQFVHCADAAGPVMTTRGGAFSTHTDTPPPSSSSHNTATGTGTGTGTPGTGTARGPTVASTSRLVTQSHAAAATAVNFHPPNSTITFYIGRVHRLGM